jgi:peptide deformylase
MSLREVITLPDPILRRKARKVTDFGPELQTLIDDMIDTLHDEPGVGLAAPQVGISWRGIVVEYGDDEKEEVPPKLYAVVNPEFSRMSTDTVVATEGCLSIPGYAGEVERAEAVTVKGQNRRGQPVTIKARDWLARIFQHEMDHLDGVLFVDRAERVWKMDQAPAQVSPADAAGG